tara:strand:- start:3297 stop:4052 length:756 start_codon:yes stop_codon:yes gene_type:complete
VSDLEKKMIDDDFYYGYLGKAALSSSSIKHLIKSPKKYKYITNNAQPMTPSMKTGWLLHCAVLEPEKFAQQTFVNVQTRNTKKFKEAAKNNDMVFTAKERSETERLQDAIYRNEQAMKLLTKCEYEVPKIGIINGLPFRAKADVWCKDRVVDLKTTMDISLWDYDKRFAAGSPYKLNYDVQVYIYCKLFNISYDKFYFLVIDKGSLDIGIIECTEEFYLSGKQKTYQAISRYVQFFIDGADIDSYTLRGKL